MASRTPCPIVQLPVEILECITLNIVGRTNILAFGLTCKALWRIVSPRHIQFHTIQARLQDGELWKSLTLNRACAALVRLLIIQSDEDQPIPSIMYMLQLDPQLRGAFDEENSPIMESEPRREEQFSQAVSVMTNLRSFTWKRTPPLGEGIWRSLGNLKRLSDLTIVDNNALFGTENNSLGNSSLRSFFICPISLTLFGLRSFELRSAPSPPLPGSKAFLSTLNSLVNNCPGLEVLKISSQLRGISPSEGKAALLRGRWPKLHALELFWSYRHTDMDQSSEAQEFLSFHRNLVRLQWRMGRLGRDNSLSPPSLPSGLPKLEMLDATSHFARMLLSSECHPPRPLRGLQVLHTDAELLHGPSSFQGVNKEALRNLELSGISSLSDLSLLADLFPNIEHLRLPSSIGEAGLWDEDIKRLRKPLNAEWAIVLANFSHLRELIGIYFLGDEDELDVEEGDQRIKYMARLFPFLELNSDGAHRILRIRRYGETAISWHTPEHSSPILYYLDSDD